MIKNWFYWYVWRLGNVMSDFTVFFVEKHNWRYNRVFQWIWDTGGALEYWSDDRQWALDCKRLGIDPNKVPNDFDVDRVMELRNGAG